MPRTDEDFPTIPGFAPVRSDDAPETAESPDVGTVATMPADVLASLDMDDTLRAMPLGNSESQNVLPLVYPDLRGRLSGVMESFPELTEVRSRLGNFAMKQSELRQHLRRVEREVSTLRNENQVLRQRLRNTESHSTAASIAASRNDQPPVRNDAQFPSAIAPPEQFRAALPHRSAPMPTMVSPPPTFAEFMPMVPQATAHPLSAAAPRPTHSLQTACDVPMPVPATAQRATPGATNAPGHYCPGLMPLTTLLAPFTEVISYRAYRLRNTRGEVTLVESSNITRIKRRFDDLYPGFAPFDGTQPIRLLEWLTTLRDGFNALEASEAVASLLLTYYLDASAKTLYASQRSSRVRSEAGALAGTWPYLIHELIKRYLSDDVLQSAYEQVTDARQKSNEDENQFADRITKAARECCNVFRDRELVNYFIRGLLPTTRDAVTERVHNLSLNERGDLTVARLIAVAEGNTFRARVKVTSTSRPAKARQSSNTLFMGEPEVAPIPIPFRRDSNILPMFGRPDSYWPNPLNNSGDADDGVSSGNVPGQ